MKNIDLDDLLCRFPRSNYSETLIEQLGVSISAVGGLLRPLIVQTVRVEEFEHSVYEVVDGAIYYYAAMHANENFILLNRVPCWVLAVPENLEAALEQLEYIATCGCDIDEELAIVTLKGSANEILA